MRWPTVTSARWPRWSRRIHCIPLLILSRSIQSRRLALFLEIVFRFCHLFSSFLCCAVCERALRGYWRLLINYHYYWSNETAIINKKSKSLGRLASHKSKLKSKVFSGIGRHSRTHVLLFRKTNLMADSRIYKHNTECGKWHFMFSAGGGETDSHECHTRERICFVLKAIPDLMIIIYEE